MSFCASPNCPTCRRRAQAEEGLRYASSYGRMGGLRLSAEGLRRLFGAEGVRGRPYDDRTGATLSSWGEAVGTPTIGYGHAIQSEADRARFARFLPGRGPAMTQEEALALVRADLVRFEDAVNGGLQVAVPQRAFDALVSYAFNIGTHSSWLARALEAINTQGLAAGAAVVRSGPVTSKGVRLQGLVTRRAQEASQILAAQQDPGVATTMTSPSGGMVSSASALSELAREAEEAAHRGGRGYRSDEVSPPTGEGGGGGMLILGGLALLGAALVFRG